MHGDGGGNDGTSATSRDLAEITDNLCALTALGERNNCGYLSFK